MNEVLSSGLAYVSYNIQTDGNGLAYSFELGVIDNNDIHVFINAIETSNFTIVSEGLMNVPDAVPNDTVLIRRIIDKSVLEVSFTDGMPFTEDTLDRAMLAANMVAHEGIDGVDNTSTGFDPTLNQVITGAWSFDISASELWWAGTSDPSAGIPEGVVAVSVASSAALSTIITSESASTSGTTARVQAYSDKVGGGSNVVVGAGSASITAITDGEGTDRGIIDAPQLDVIVPIDKATLSEHPSGSVPLALASVDYVDNVAAAGFNPASSQNISGQWDFSTGKLTCFTAGTNTEAVNLGQMNSAIAPLATTTALGVTDAKAVAAQESIDKIHTLIISSSGVGIHVPTGWSVSKLGVGQYRVAHTLGTVDYIAQATIGNSNPHFVGISTALSTRFDVYTYNSAGVADDVSIYITITDIT